MRNTGSQWEAIRRDLEALATSVAADIRAYPRPITACDALFNHLLELRRLIPQELERLEAAAQTPDMTTDAFIGSSPCAAEIGVATGSDPPAASVAKAASRA